jgi:hypothetical protein
MSAAKLPLPYRDSCAHLLIPLNRCRVEEYYLPWKCEVCGAWDERKDESGRLTKPLERETFLRKVPVRRVQGAGQEDGRAEGSQERTAKQLEPLCGMADYEVTITSGECCMYISKQQVSRSHQFQVLGDKWHFELKALKQENHCSDSHSIRVDRQCIFNAEPLSC